METISNHHHSFRSSISFKRAILFCLFACFIGLSWYLRRKGHLDPELILLFIDSYPVIAPLIYILAYAASVLLVVPSLSLNIGAGIVWGWIGGGIVATIASTIGATASFALMNAICGRTSISQSSR